MKKSFTKKMSDAFDQCPGAALGDMPTTEQSEGSIIVDPVCSKQALVFLKRRFYVEESVGIESTGELRFVIKAKPTRTGGKRKPVVWRPKAVQFELPLNL